ncbi:MAG TPA: Uma2 family endonuclease [Phycisphaerae bacterium]|jgi:Uma2 family endonuclease|nr:Uma2 family endonuclease [Phycisphaerae bacterium]
MTIAAKLLTADDLWNMPGNGDGYELVMGELRPMPPSGQQHSSIGARLVIRIGAFVEKQHLGIITTADGGYILHRNPDTVRAPDVGFVTTDRLPNGRTAQKWFPGHPDLAVEIISPTDVYGDVDEKVQEFLDAGTRLVWVVNPRHKTVTVFRNDTTITALGPGDQLSGESVLPGFTLAISEIFE